MATKMNYLLDRKLKRKKILSIVALAFLVIIFFYFREPLSNFLSASVHSIFRPMLGLRRSIGSVFSSLDSAFMYKKNLAEENESLKLKLKEADVRLLGYNSLLEENSRFKEILGRKEEKENFLLSAVLSKPNQNPYDTLIVDVGETDGVETGNMVFALGNVPVGRVAAVYSKTSKVVLFSSSGEKMRVAVNGGGVVMEVAGRGGGNFEMILPRDFVLPEESVAILPGIFPYVVAIVKTIISDPRDSFQKALLVSPANMQEFGFVEIRITN